MLAATVLTSPASLSGTDGAKEAPRELTHQAEDNSGEPTFFKNTNWNNRLLTRRASVAQTVDTAAMTSLRRRGATKNHRVLARATTT
jgi:hypothetical protein